jgi:fatty acid CoA ligase FadD9
LVPTEVHPLVQVSYIPLSHSSDRLRLWSTALAGGRVGICRYGSDSSGIADLIEDIETLRPTLLLAPPRIWNGLYAQFLQQVDARVLAALSSSSSEQKATDRDAIEAKISDELLTTVASCTLGGRIRAINTGAAPTSSEVMQFMRHAWAHQGIGVSEGYGATEGGGIAVNIALPKDNKDDGVLSINGWTGLKLMQNSSYRLRFDGKVLTLYSFFTHSSLVIYSMSR